MTELATLSHAILPITLVLLADRFFDIWSWLRKVWKSLVALVMSLVLAGCANTGDPRQDAVNNALAGAAVGAVVGSVLTRPAPAVVVPVRPYGYAPYGYVPARPHNYYPYGYGGPYVGNPHLYQVPRPVYPHGRR